METMRHTLFDERERCLTGQVRLDEIQQEDQPIPCVITFCITDIAQLAHSLQTAAQHPL